MDSTWVNQESVPFAAHSFILFHSVPFHSIPFRVVSFHRHERSPDLSVCEQQVFPYSGTVRGRPNLFPQSTIHTTLLYLESIGTFHAVTTAQTKKSGGSETSAATTPAPPINAPARAVAANVVKLVRLVSISVLTVSVLTRLAGRSS